VEDEDQFELVHESHLVPILQCVTPHECVDFLYIMTIAALWIRCSCTNVGNPAAVHPFVSSSLR